MSTRRALLKTATTLPLATVLANAQLLRAAAASTTQVEITTPSGKQIKAELAEPSGAAKGGVVLIHEWWGLNEQIKAVAAELAANHFVALAVDLYDGRVTSNRDDARSFMKSVDAGVATETLVTWTKWLRSNAKTHARVGTVGWCFGGGWSLNASIADPVDATVVYYGRVDRSSADLARLKGPVLGHFATQDIMNAQPDLGS